MRFAAALAVIVNYKNKENIMWYVKLPDDIEKKWAFPAGPYQSKMQAEAVAIRLARSLHPSVEVRVVEDFDI